MRDLDITSLRLFVAVCETRSIARAAELHHMVPSAISKRLAQLADDVGQPLFTRQRRGVMPTDAGEILLEHAHAMLVGADRLARDMASYGRGVKGQVRILASISSIAEHLPDDIASFLQNPAHADIRVDLEERMSRDLVRAVREGSAPLGICWDTADLEGLQTRRYRSDHLAIAVHPAHPLAAQDRCTFAQTLDCEHIGLPSTTAVQSMLMRAAAIIGHPLNYRVVVSTFDAALRCVRAGLGISVIPMEALVRTPNDEGVRLVPLADAWAQRNFAILFRDAQALSPAARLLVAHLERIGNPVKVTGLPQN